jgi:selenocysteine-specific elongation factor
MPASTEGSSSSTPVGVSLSTPIAAPVDSKPTTRATGSTPSAQVLATAGHVDHGKSTLVRTLTGVDPDRWAEEKQRGLTIDLGFAHCVLPSGRGVGFIDVPGHVRFLKNMLAGVGAIDACLFVVAATEGWKPQSEEHLRILELLGVSHGVIALTKVGLVDDEWAELARLDVEDHVAGTFLEGAEIVLIDALTNRGVDDLREALDRCLTSTPLATDRGRPRLWIDRSFAAKGAGTIVTGTLSGGTFAVDDIVDVVGPIVGHQSARIRSLQSHGRSVRSVGPGNRVAINLNGISHDELGRGDAIVHAGRWQHSTRFDARLQTLAALDHDVSRRGAYAVYIGAGEHPVKLRVLGPTTVPPGSSGFVRLHLPVALTLQPGDRFIVRDHGREETVGGGEVLDVSPAKPASKANPQAGIEHIVDERGWVKLDLLERLSGGESWSGLVVDGNAVSPGALAATRTKVLERLTGSKDPLGLDPALLSEHERCVLPLMHDVGVRIEQGRVVQGEVRDPLADHPFVRALIEAGFAPPDPAGVDRAELRELVRRKLIVEQEGLYFVPAAIDAAARVVAQLLAENPDGVTVAQVRDGLGVTRKHALPLAAILDATGVTRRRGDLRIPGPRLPKL